jgi:hypothetical protein
MPAAVTHQRVVGERRNEPSVNFRAAASSLARFRSSIKIDLDGRFELREGALKSIQVDGDVYAFLVGHGMGPGQSASDVLRQALFRAIDIDDDLSTLISCRWRLARVKRPTPFCAAS